MDCKLFLGRGIAIWKQFGIIVSVVSKRLTMSDANNANAGPSPPYVSFPTLKTLLKSFQEHGTPGRVDRTVLQPTRRWPNLIFKLPRRRNSMRLSTKPIPARKTSFVSPRRSIWPQRRKPRFRSAPTFCGTKSRAQGQQRSVWQRRTNPNKPAERVATTYHQKTRLLVIADFRCTS